MHNPEDGGGPKIGADVSIVSRDSKIQGGGVEEMKELFRVFYGLEKKQGGF